MAAIDANILRLMLDPDAEVRVDGESGDPIEGAKERVEYLIERLDESGEQIIIPAPVLAEALVSAGPEAPKIVEKIKTYSCIKIVPFDELAAIELAQDHHTDIQNGDKKAGVDAPWQKIKVDRQALAIAKTLGEETFYCDDGPLTKLAKDAGMKVYGISDLPLRPVEPQGELWSETDDGTQEDG